MGQNKASIIRPDESSDDGDTVVDSLFSAKRNQIMKPFIITELDAAQEISKNSTSPSPK